jgi:2-dehydropantoate 2-reductase
MGEIIAEKMKNKAIFLSGVAYVAVFRESPGVVRQKLPFYRVVFGPIDGQLTKIMWKVRQDMLDAGMASELIKDPVQGALRKFIRVSTSSAVQAYFNTNAGGIRDNPERLDFKIRLASEIIDIANARGTPFEDDALEDMITSAYTLPASYQTSMKNDLDAGHRVEFQTMIFDVYDFGKKLGLEMKAYGEVCRKFGYIA